MWLEVIPCKTSSIFDLAVSTWWTEELAQAQNEQIHLFFLVMQKAIRPLSRRFLRVMRVAEKGLCVLTRLVLAPIC